MNVLIIGGTGLISTGIVKALRERGAAGAEWASKSEAASRGRCFISLQPYRILQGNETLSKWTVR